MHCHHILPHNCGHGWAVVLGCSRDLDPIGEGQWKDSKERSHLPVPRKALSHRYLEKAARHHLGTRCPLRKTAESSLERI